MADRKPVLRLYDNDPTMVVLDSHKGGKCGNGNFIWNVIGPDEAEMVIFVKPEENEILKVYGKGAAVTLTKFKDDLDIKGEGAPPKEGEWMDGHLTPVEKKVSDAKIVSEFAAQRPLSRDDRLRYRSMCLAYAKDIAVSRGLAEEETMHVAGLLFDWLLEEPVEEDVNYIQMILDVVDDDITEEQWEGLEKDFNEVAGGPFLLADYNKDSLKNSLEKMDKEDLELIYQSL